MSQEGSIGDLRLTSLRGVDQDLRDREHGRFCVQNDVVKKIVSRDRLVLVQLKRPKREKRMMERRDEFDKVRSGSLSSTGDLETSNVCVNSVVQLTSSLRETISPPVKRSLVPPAAPLRGFHFEPLIKTAERPHM